MAAMLPSVGFVILLLAADSTPGSVANGAAELLDCDLATACVPMLLSIENPTAEAAIIVGATELPDGYTLFRLDIRGVLNGVEAKHEFTFRGYTDGIECSPFGQGNVGFLGFSQRGNQIVRTSAGPLEILDAALVAGCPTCLLRRSRTSGAVLAPSLTPSWDLSLTGHIQDDFSVDESGNLQLRQNGQCLRILPNQPLEAVDPSACAHDWSNDWELQFRIGACT